MKHAIYDPTWPGLAYSHHGGGDGLLSMVMHSALWSFVSRIIRHVPLSVALLLVVGLVLLVAVRRRRSARLPRRGRIRR